MTGVGRQSLNPSPWNPCMQLQTGLWLRTRQSAFALQDPGHGSTQRWLIQALVDGQSELTIHSGRQFGAVPIMLAKQPHWACPATTVHCELGPQGCGLHGFGGSGRKVPSSTTGLGLATTSASQWLINMQNYMVSYWSVLLGVIWHPVNGSPV